MTGRTSARTHTVSLNILWVQKKSTRAHTTECVINTKESGAHIPLWRLQLQTGLCSSSEGETILL